MRHPSFILCASIAACGYASLASATNPPLAFTLDLYGSTGTHPTDIGLNAVANTFSYAPGADGSFVATMAMSSPAVCDEVASDGTLGAKSSLRLAPTFSNNAGGLLEFNAGGASIVDVGAIIFDGDTPPGVAASYSNLGAATPQVVCYQINPISGGPLAYAAGPSGIFAGSFEGHPDPWVSVQTVFSPSAGLQRPSGQTSIAPQPNDMAYVVQIHNPVAGWHLDFGYDTAYFDPANNGGGGAPNWCVLTSAQPGALGTCGSLSGQYGVVTSSLPYTVAARDIQAASNSVYLQVVMAGSSVATSSWSTLTSGFYPALASVFPPYGTYPQRFDDKVAVASANNLPMLNIGSIVCNNDKSSPSCMIADQDGHAVPAALNFANTISGSGTVNADPLVYFVDPSSGTTLPGNVAALTVDSASCDDPNGILASPISTSNVTTSPSAPGGKALAFGFKPSGLLYVPGTATCTATFTSHYLPSLPLSTTQSFTITMLPATVTHFSVTAPASTTAGGAFNNLAVTALDGANNVVSTYSGTVHFFSNTDNLAVLPANATLTGGTGTFSATFKTAGSQTITARDSVTSSINGTSGGTTVNAGPATHFTVNSPPSATTGVAFNISVAAYDQFNNLATGYAGTAHFTSTDVAAMLPANSILTFGVGTFSATLISPGTRTITATDTVTLSITGTSSAITVN